MKLHILKSLFISKADRHIGDTELRQKAPNHLRPHAPDAHGVARAKAENQKLKAGTQELESSLLLPGCALAGKLDQKRTTHTEPSTLT